MSELADLFARLAALPADQRQAVARLLTSPPAPPPGFAADDRLPHEREKEEGAT